MITLTVDNQHIQAQKGLFLLKVCLDNHIYIPNLCFIEDNELPHACCRLCFVEIEGQKNPVPSCTVHVQEGMVVRTDTPEVRRLQKTAFNLIISTHEIYPVCPVKDRCELTTIAKFLGMKLKPSGIKRILRENAVSSSHPLFDFYLNRCILCEKCIYTCTKKNGYSILTVAKRGFETTLAYFGTKDAAGLPCADCLACVSACPVGAIVQKVTS